MSKILVFGLAEPTGFCHVSFGGGDEQDADTLATWEKYDREVLRYFSEVKVIQNKEQEQERNAMEVEKDLLGDFAQYS